MLTFRDKYASNGKYSQNGEQGIIDEVLRRLPEHLDTFAEYGAHDGLFCSNTRHLLERGWNGFMIEADAGLFSKLQVNTTYFVSNRSLHIKCEPVTPTNINALFEDIHVLSIDTDGANDYRCFMAMDTKIIYPDVLIIEINSSIDPETFSVTDAGGASYLAMVELGIKKGYILLCHTGNLVFVKAEHSDKFPEITGVSPLFNWEHFFDTKWLK